MAGWEDIFEAVYQYACINNQHQSSDAKEQNSEYQDFYRRKLIFEILKLFNCKVTNCSSQH